MFNVHNISVKFSNQTHLIPTCFAPRHSGKYCYFNTQSIQNNNSSNDSTLSGMGIKMGARSPDEVSLVAIYNIKDKQNPLSIYNNKFSDQPVILTKSDPEVQACYDNFKVIDDFFRNELRLRITNSVNRFINIQINHPDWKNNACWNGDSVIIGETDQNLFRCQARSLELLSHEIGHAIVQHSSNFKYCQQSGALNESIADIIAMMIKHYNNGSYADDPNTSWLYGEGEILGAIEGSSIRSLKEPGTAHKGHPECGDDLQVGHMSQYQTTCCFQHPADYNDYENVHINSGIPNKAFYLASNAIGGGSWQKPGKIWLTALTNANENDSFADFACRTMSAVKELGYGAYDFHAVGKAWSDVGVDLRKHSNNIYTPSKTILDLEQSIKFFQRNDISNGMKYFNQACLHEIDVIHGVYRNLWNMKGRLRNGCLEYGRYAFHNSHGYSSSQYEKAAAVQLYKDALLDYESMTSYSPFYSVEEQDCLKIFHQLISNNMPSCIKDLLPVKI